MHSGSVTYTVPVFSVSRYQYHFCPVRSHWIVITFRNLTFIGVHFHWLHRVWQDNPGASVHPGRNENQKVRIPFLLKILDTGSLRNYEVHLEVLKSFWRRNMFLTENITLLMNFLNVLTRSIVCK